MYRNDTVYKKIAEELERAGFVRTAKQCRDKVKQLKSQYKTEVDKLRKSGVGVESDDEDGIFTNFKWFFELHRILKKRANINPVHLLESSASASGHTQSSQLVDTPELLSVDEVDNAPADGTQSLVSERSPTPTSRPCTPSTAQPSPSSSSSASTVKTSMTATTSSSSMPGPSGSKAKRRKITKSDRAEKTAMMMFDKFIALQQESTKKFEEIEEDELGGRAAEERN